MRSGPRFDTTISVAHVLQVMAILLALWAATARLENRLATIETKLDPLWRWFVTTAAPPPP